jgi:hypothetical protein
MNISGNLENLSLHGLYHEDSLALKWPKWVYLFKHDSEGVWSKAASQILK